ncbi:hypothetical protein AALP_AAs50104U000100 [Arabis alpina]|uniref:Uncharacterized protein n=1 Tax=Arabis alpina TaxID=50452 RepID=A0A087FZ14_ARAAL|nr:hypothetical protein AALP_AAs50104U000100 [Arabis alpina]
MCHDKDFKSLSTSFTPERNASLNVDHETPPVNFDPFFLTGIEASVSTFAPVYANTLEQTGVNLEASIPFVDTSDRTGAGFGEQYPNEQIDQDQVAQEQIVQEILAVQFDTYKISHSLSDERSLDSMRMVCPMYCENKNICFSHMTMAGTCNLVDTTRTYHSRWNPSMVSHPPAPSLVDLPFKEDLNKIRVRNHRWYDLSYTRVRRARDRLDIWNSEYWTAEMRGRIPRLQDSEDNIEGVFLPNQEETPAIKDGSQKIPSVTDTADIQRVNDSSARGSVLGEFNEPKDLGNAFRSNGKRKVDPVDKKAEKKRIAAKVKTDLKVGRILAFRIGGTCEVIPSEAPVAQSLGVIPHASLSVSFDSASVPSCATVQTAVNVPHLSPSRASLTPSSKPPRRSHPMINTGNHIVSAYKAEVQRRKDRIKTLASRSDVDAAWQDVDRQICKGDSWEATTSQNQHSINDLFDQPSALKEEKQRLEDEVKKRDVHLEAASTKIAELRTSLEMSHLTEDHLRKERDGARRQADEIAGGSSAQSARHLSRLERIRSYLVALHAQEENYAKEEEEYLAKVESLAVDSLGDDIMFPTLPPPPAGPPWDVSSQVPEGITEHGSFLSPQDNHDGDLV